MRQRPLSGRAATSISGGDQLDTGGRIVLDSIRAGLFVSQDAGEVAEAQAGFGERLADQVAAIGGSWGFIIVFGLVLLGWMMLNTDILSKWGLAFDPYPYVFLNLILSMLAAIQAPVIMMSQNRQAAKDRVAAQLDYQVNLRAELEILRLHNSIEAGVGRRLDSIETRLEQLLACRREDAAAPPDSGLEGVPS